jgi:RHS repeat-associated protein
MWTPNINLATGNAQTVFDTVGRKFFELSNHLGNVLATITDRRLQVSDNGTTPALNYLLPDVVTAQSYYAFGMQQPGLTYNSGSYRYGFNGKENDNEVKGVGDQQDYGMRIYDPRIGRFLSVDPIEKDFPYLTPYQFASNRPIDGIDLDGLEIFLTSSTVLETAVETGLKPALSSYEVTSGGVIQGSGFRIPTYDVMPFAVPNFSQLKPTSSGNIPQQSPQKKPGPVANPDRQFDPRLKPSKEEDGSDGYYVYETGSTDKIRSGLVDKSADNLPYFGVTKNAFETSPGMIGRYNKAHERVELYKGILGKTDKQTALGVESALIALNTYGKNFEKNIAGLSSADVRKSTRIDNKIFSSKDANILRNGIRWLDHNYKNWRTDFYHNENKKGPNNPSP